MADVDAVLERLIGDLGFREQLGRDPAAALAGYDLSAEDLQLLDRSLDASDDVAQRGVEQRTSKSAVVGLLASLSGGGPGSQEMAINTKGTGITSGRLAGGAGPGSASQDFAINTKGTGTSAGRLSGGEGPGAQDHAINTKGTAVNPGRLAGDGGPVAQEHAINTKGTGASTGRVPAGAADGLLEAPDEPTTWTGAAAPAASRPAPEQDFLTVDDEVRGQIPAKIIQDGNCEEGE